MVDNQFDQVAAPTCQKWVQWAKRSFWHLTTIFMFESALHTHMSSTVFRIPIAISSASSPRRGAEVVASSGQWLSVDDGHHLRDVVSPVRDMER